MKDLILPAEVLASSCGVTTLVRGGCLHCRGDLRLPAEGFLRLDRPTRCPRCGVEHRVDTSRDGRTVKVRLPRNADAWFEVESSNLAAVGRRGADLIVRFKAGAEYLYPGAGPLLPELLTAESKGRFFAASVRTRPCRRFPGT